MKSWNVSLKNRFPNAQVIAHGNGLDLDVFSAQGELLCALRNGADAQGMLGAKYPWSLEPIPKDARCWKVCPVKGHIVKDELFDQRVKAREEYLNADGDRILSQAEYDALPDAEGSQPAPVVAVSKKKKKK